MNHSVIVSLELLFVCLDFIGLFDQVCSRHLQWSVNWYPWLTSWSLLDEHPDQYAANTLATLDQQWVDSQPSVDWLMCNCWPRCQYSVDWVSIKMLIDCINWQSTAGAVNTHEPVCLQKKSPSLGLMFSISLLNWVTLFQMASLNLHCNYNKRSSLILKA